VSLPPPAAAGLDEGVSASSRGGALDHSVPAPPSRRLLLWAGAALLLVVVGGGVAAKRMLSANDQLPAAKESSRPAIEASISAAAAPPEASSSRPEVTPMPDGGRPASRARSDSLRRGARTTSRPQASGCAAGSEREPEVTPTLREPEAAAPEPVPRPLASQLRPPTPAQKHGLHQRNPY